MVLAGGCVEDRQLHAGRNVVKQPVGREEDFACPGGVRVGEDERRPAVGRCPDPGRERDPREQRRVEGLRQLLATARAEQRALLTAARTDERGHVLDHPGHVQVGVLRHPARPFGDVCDRVLRRRDDDDAGGRKHRADRERDVTGPRRQIADEHVELTPVDLRDELPHRLVQQRATPYDRRLLLGKEADGHHLDPVALGREQQAVDGVRSRRDPEHARHREAPHVGVDQPDALAALSDRAREVDGERGLADAAFAGCDRDHRRPVGECGGNLAAARAGAQSGDERATLLGVHRLEVHLDAVDAVHRAECRGDVLCDPGLHRATGHRERDADPGGAALEFDPPQHVELAKRYANLRITYRGDRHPGLLGESRAKRTRAAHIKRCVVPESGTHIGSHGQPDRC